MKKINLLIFVYMLLASTQIHGQCVVDEECLPLIQTYHCLEQQGSNPMLMSDIIAQNVNITPSMSGAGFIIDGELTIDVDFQLTLVGHIVLLPGSSIVIDDMTPNNGIGPEVVFSDNIQISSCGGYWKSITVKEDAYLEISQYCYIQQGEEGIIVEEGGILWANQCSYKDFQKSAIQLGDPNGPLDQYIPSGVMLNSFIDIPRPINIYNTEVASVYSNNYIQIDPNLVGTGTAIHIENSSVSSVGSTIDDFEYGVVVINDSGDNHFLNIDDFTITNTEKGISAGDTPLPGSTSNGISLYLKNSSFNNYEKGVEVKIQNGGTALLLKNTFLDSANEALNAVTVNSDFPHEINVTRNIVDSPLSGSGINVSAPLWFAKETARFSKNDLNVQEYGIQIDLATGGYIDENTITTANGLGIISINTRGITIVYNEIEVLTGNGIDQGAIYMTESPYSNITCNIIDGNETGGGIVFRETCSSSSVARNKMDNLTRGLSIYSLNGDGVIGEQYYRDNRWNGASIAEAYMGAPSGVMINPILYLWNQFRVQQNSGSIWPNPILPSQSTSGNNPLEWFYFLDNNTLPELCPSIAGEQIGENGNPADLSSFDWALINNTISSIPGAEGKYRDADFRIYARLLENPLLIEPTNQAYFNTLNTAYFQKRYDFWNKLKSLSNQVTSLVIDEQIVLLLEQLEELATLEAANEKEDWMVLMEEIKGTQTNIASEQANFKLTLTNEVTDINAGMLTWNSTLPSDNLFKGIVDVYFNNFGLGFEQYSSSDRTIIEHYANLCPVEYGEGVYWAKSIAGVLSVSNLFNSCSSIPGVAKGKNRIENSHKYSGFRVYPSPTDGFININYPIEQVREVRIINALGQVVRQYDTAIIQLDLSSEQTGLYMIEVWGRNNEKYVEKIFLQ